MTRIRLIILAALAVFAVSAVASATASAASKGEFVNSESKPLVKNVFTATSGETKLETVGGTKVTCKKDLALGIQTSATGGEQTVHFSGCESSKLGCKSLKPATSVPGEIIVLTGLLVQKLSATADTVVNTILEPGSKPAKAGEIEFECSGIKIKVKGSFYSNKVEPLNTLKTLWALTATQTKGVQTQGTNEAGAPLKLETSIEGKAFEGSGQEGTETVHFLEEGQFV